MDRITVVATPRMFNLKRPREGRLVPAYERTVTVTRAQALAVVRQHLGVSTFSELIDQGATMTNTWTRDFKRCYYTDQGAPGNIRFVADLEALPPQ